MERLNRRQTESHQVYLNGRGAKEEGEANYSDYPESRESKAKPSDGAVSGEAEFTQTIPSRERARRSQANCHIKIEANAISGKITCLFFQKKHLPLQRDSKHRKRKAKTDSMAKYGTILVVDDNTSIFTTLEICLDGVFDRILTLTKPESILTMLEQETVDVVLLDMNFSLGVNNGQEGLLWVQAVHRRHPHIPIVLMTAYADVKLAVKGLKSGAVDFVTKPWDNHDLIRVLKDAVDASTEVVPLEKMEEEHVRKVVDKCHGNISKAAELLEISRQRLYKKLGK